jgi:hypothetical protein
MSPQPIQTKYIPKSTNILSSKTSLKQIFNEALAKTRANTESPRRKPPSYAFDETSKENLEPNILSCPINIEKIRIKSTTPTLLQHDKKKPMSATSPSYKNPLYFRNSPLRSKEFELKNPKRSSTFKDILRKEPNSSLTSIPESRPSDTDSRKSHLRYLKELDELVKSYSRMSVKYEPKVPLPRLSQTKVLTYSPLDPAEKTENEEEISDDEQTKKTPEETIEDHTLTSPLQFSKLLMNNVNKSGSSKAKSKLDFSNLQ